MTDGLYQKIDRDMRKRWALDDKLKKRELWCDRVSGATMLAFILLALFTACSWHEPYTNYLLITLGAIAAVGLTCDITANKAKKQRRNL